MICTCPSQNESPPGARPCPRPAAGPKSPYGRPFWRAYVANTLIMTAVALLFRYADFVTLLGGNELHLGWIVGIGMVGSLAMRLYLGSGIDRYGARRIWLASLVVFSLCCFAHLAVTTYRGPAVYLLRILYCCSIGGIFGASMTFISGRAPIARMAEMIGMLGTSGFFGMVLGTQLGDLLCGTATIQRWQVDRMFIVAGLLGCFSLLFVWLATRGLVVPGLRRRPPMLWILRRYRPGTVLLVGVAMGVGIGLPGTFLRTYAAELNIARIGLFFAVYSPTAILVRLLTRRLPERVGLRPMILFGLAVLAVSQFAFLPVHNQWTLVVPGIGYGIAHAILFPTVVAAGSSSFPNRYRGLGTTLMLATFDVGQLVGAPAAGVIVHTSATFGLPGYTTMYLSIAVFLGVVIVVFAATSHVAQGPRAMRSRRLAHARPHPDACAIAACEPAVPAQVQEPGPPVISG